MFDYNRGKIIANVELIEKIGAKSESIITACAAIRDTLEYENWGETEPETPAPADKTEKPKQQGKDDLKPEKPEKSAKPAKTNTRKPEKLIDPAEQAQHIASIQAAINAEKATGIESTLEACRKHKIKFHHVAVATGCNLYSVYAVSKGDISKAFAEKFNAIFKLHKEA